MENLPRRQMLAVRKRILQIRDYPGNFSAYGEFDQGGRRLEIHIIDRLAIRYWIDDADRAVKVLGIFPADQSD